MTLTGGCLCGAVRFETSEQPQWIVHCHCEPCRKASGAAFLSGLMYRGEAIRWTGETNGYESSPGIWRVFCGSCGGSLAFRQDAAPEKDVLLLGAFDDPSKIEIHDNVNHIFAERELAWLHVDDGFPRVEGIPDGLFRID
jgi:hypothetical protein